MVLNSQKYIDILLEFAKHEKWNSSYRRISKLNQMLMVNYGTSKADLEKFIRGLRYLQNKPLHGYEFSYDNARSNTELFNQAKKSF